MRRNYEPSVTGSHGPRTPPTARRSPEPRAALSARRSPSQSSSPELVEIDPEMASIHQNAGSRSDSDEFVSSHGHTPTPPAVARSMSDSGIPEFVAQLNAYGQRESATASPSRSLPRAESPSRMMAAPEVIRAASSPAMRASSLSAMRAESVPARTGASTSLPRAESPSEMRAASPSAMRGFSSEM